METLQPVSTFGAQLAALANLVAVGGLLAAGKVHLYQNVVSPGRGTTLADLTEADFTGYAAVSWGTWGAPYIAVDGNAHVTAPGLQFQATDAVAPNTIYGAYLTDTAGATLIAIVQFVEPVPILNAQDGLVYTPDWIYGQ